ncbi:MAG: glycoside hydrolase family 9 protein, partial [Oscillospiraceae bacterium]|nr:glycoside hydrolase family 9 protein [Oscillospiraceae bacterium]
MKLKQRLTAVLTSFAMVSAVMVPVTTPAPVIEAATSYVNYAKALQYSLYLFDANMCGTDVGENSDLSWRGDCHTQDANREVNINGTNYNVDVSGGYHDAGDHMKFSLPAGQAMSTLNLAYYKFGDAFDSTGQTAHLKKIMQREADYLSRCIIRNSSGSVVGFVVQVGDNSGDPGNADHNSQVAPEQQAYTNREVVVASSSNPCSD